MKHKYENGQIFKLRQPNFYRAFAATLEDGAQVTIVEPAEQGGTHLAYYVEVDGKDYQQIAAEKDLYE